MPAFGKIRDNTLIFVLLFIIKSNALSQNVFYIKTEKASSLITYKTNTYKNSLKSLLAKLHRAGFTAAAIDSIKTQADTPLIYMYIGDIYLIDSICYISKKSSFCQNVIVPFEKKYLENLIQKQILKLKNNGYPFASYKISKIETQEYRLTGQNSIKLEKNKIPELKDISKTLKIDQFTIHFLKIDVNLFTGRYFVFDTVYIPPDAKISKNFLANYLDIKPGQAYCQKKINLVQAKLQQLRYIQLKRKPHIEFYRGVARVVLPIKTLNSNNIEVLIGAQFENKQIHTFGNVNISLTNLLRNGEKLSIQWQKPKNQWQTLQMALSYPYLGLPIGINANFFSQKIDTSNFNLSYHIALSYYPYALNYIALGFQKQLHFTSHENQNSTDVKSKNLTFTLNLQNIKFLQAIPAGYQAYFFLSYGNKTFNDSSLQHLNLNIDALDYQSIYRKFILKTSFKAMLMHSSKIFDNETVYLGGTNDFLGFDQMSFRATSFVLGTLEPQFYANKKLIISILAQKGKIWLNTISNHKQTNTLALGLGLNIKTKNSAINLIFATGTTNNTLNPANTKVHISYKTRF